MASMRMLPRCTILCVAVAAAWLLTGCGDACDELDDRCAECSEPAVAVTCAVLVGEDNADACQRQLDDPTFQQTCP